MKLITTYFLFSVLTETKSHFRSQKGVLDSQIRDLLFEFCTIGKYENLTKIRCMARCLEHESCSTFAYNRREAKCRLYSVNFRKGINGTTETGWKYYLIKDVLCPADYVVVVEGCFCLKYFVKLPTADSYTAKAGVCEKEGTHLLKIDTPERHNATRDYLVSTGDPKRAVIQGKIISHVLTYDDGTNMTYFNWDVGEPDFNKVYPIKYITLRPPSLLWSDTSDITDMAFLCGVNFDQ